MAIHHDKSIYGKLRPLSEEYGEDDLIAAARALNGKTEKPEEPEETLGGEVSRKADEKTKNAKNMKKL